MNPTDHRVFFFALTRIKGIGPVRLRTLLSFFPSAADAWYATPGDLQAAGLTGKSGETIDSGLKAVPDDKSLSTLKKNFDLLKQAVADPQLMPVVISYMRDPLAEEVDLTLLQTMIEGSKSDD